MRVARVHPIPALSHTRMPFLFWQVSCAEEPGFETIACALLMSSLQLGSVSGVTVGKGRFKELKVRR